MSFGTGSSMLHRGEGKLRSDNARIVLFTRIKVHLQFAIDKLKKIYGLVRCKTT
jgi:hypothetical protein